MLTDSVEGAPAQIATAPTAALLDASVDTEFFRSLRELMAKCDKENDRNTTVITLIHACIDYGINRGSRIRGALKSIGCNGDHVGIILRHGRGSDPKRHHWHRNENKIYSILNKAMVVPVQPISAAHIEVPRS